MMEDLYKNQLYIYDFNKPSPLANVAVNYIKNHSLDNEAIDIIDIGCGHGRDLYFFSENLNYNEMIGIDISEEAISKAQIICSNVPNLKLYNYNLKNIKNIQVDVAFCAGVIHFLKKKERIMFRDIINRILKPKGLFFFCTLSSNDKMYYGKGRSVEKDPNSFEDQTYLHFSSENELRAEYGFLKIEKLYEYYQKDYPNDIEYHTSWISIGKRI